MDLIGLTIDVDGMGAGLYAIHEAVTRIAAATMSAAKLARCPTTPGAPHGH